MKFFFLIYLLFVCLFELTGAQGRRSFRNRNSQREILFTFLTLELLLQMTGLCRIEGTNECVVPLGLPSMSPKAIWSLLHTHIYIFLFIYFYFSWSWFTSLSLQSTGRSQSNHWHGLILCPIFYCCPTFVLCCSSDPGSL